jgi:signal transduction histidine kinase
MDKRILIHAPVGRDALLASRVLQDAKLECFICKTIPDVLEQLRKGAGALFIVEEALAAGGLAPIGQYVADQPDWSDIPIIVLTSNAGNATGLQSVVETLGNFTLLERPVRTASMISAARSAVRGRQRQYQMRETDRLKDEFLASLGHELRNPLAPIRTSMQVLARLLPGEEEVGNITRLVERQVAHLTRLVDDLLDVARVTSGKVTLQKKQVLLSEVMQHTFEICQPLLEASRHTLDVVAPRQAVMLEVDAARLVQSLSNVLANAIKFTPQPSTITFRAHVAQTMLTIEIQDAGIGLEPASLSRIFDMFAQDDPVRGQVLGGLGIGLSLTKRFTEMHGGTIHAYSEGSGTGCLIVLALPVVIMPEQEGADGPVRAAASPVDTGELLVLVVDDNRDGADMLQMMLELDGYRVAKAYDGLGAVEAAREMHPQVVLMDIGLPDMDGYEAARRIREQAGGEDITLIALTGWGHEDARRQAREAGMNHHLVKPVDLSILKGYLGEIAAAR